MTSITSQIKKLIPLGIKIQLRKILNLLLPGENIRNSKIKWNKLAEANARYYVLTDLGEKISEEEFRAAGKKDFQELITTDTLIVEKLGNFKEKIILEIGCGIGRITEFLAQNFAKVYGIDISEEMITKGRERLKNYKNIEFIANDGKVYPLPDSSVDFVFSYIVFQHMPNKKIIESNFQEIKRVLKKNGLAKIQVRGLPTSKSNWFYGPAFTQSEIKIMLNIIGLTLIKTIGENQRYFWVWLTK